MHNHGPAPKEVPLASDNKKKKKAMRHVLDLFSGVGNFSLGLARAGGFRTIGFCEIDPTCHPVLQRHFPGVPIHQDITKLRGSDVRPEFEYLEPDAEFLEPDERGL